jgi:hypothetical protein
MECVVHRIGNILKLKRARGCGLKNHATRDSAEHGNERQCSAVQGKARHGKAEWKRKVLYGIEQNRTEQNKIERVEKNRIK